MNQYQFLKQLGNIPRPGGDGVKVSRPINPIAGLRTAAGLVLTGATAPSVQALETNALGVQAAASSNVLGSFVFELPGDYDNVADKLEIVVKAVSGGATDTPTLNATAYSKRAGVALTSALTSVASAAISATASAVTIKLSGNSLQGGDTLTINLVSGAHTTDTVSIFSVAVHYKSAIVFSDPSARNIV